MDFLELVGCLITISAMAVASIMYSNKAYHCATGALVSGMIPIAYMVFMTLAKLN